MKSLAGRGAIPCDGGAKSANHRAPPLELARDRRRGRDDDAGTLTCPVEALPVGQVADHCAGTHGLQSLNVGSRANETTDVRGPLTQPIDYPTAEVARTADNKDHGPPPVQLRPTLATLRCPAENGS